MKKDSGLLIGVQICCIIVSVSAVVFVLINNLNDEVMQMSEGGIVAIVVAVIGAIVSIVGLILTTIKETKKVGEVKEDTVYVRPKVDFIDRNTSDTNNQVTKKLFPT